MFGSMPCSSTMSRSLPGGRQSEIRVDGHTDLAGDAVDLPDRRPVDLIVVVVLVVELRERLGLPDRIQVLQRATGGVAGVVPAFESGDENRMS